jgi:4-amino-4-deoxy-L-arabinose transferase-like glycosyltransferase
MSLGTQTGNASAERTGIAGWMIGLVLAALCLLVLVPGIAGLPPTDRDESRYLQSTKQMVETGDYIDIRLQAENRYKKPIGIYWMQAAAVNLSGQGADAPIWVYRTVSVTGATLAVLVVFGFGTRLFGQRAGLVAALGTLAILGVAFEARIAKVDAMLLGVTVAAQAALGMIYVARKRAEVPAVWLAYAFWLAQGVGILLKGPITPLVAGMTVLALVIFDRDRSWLSSLRTGRGILIAALVALPWPLLITMKSGMAFWQEAVVNDLLGKVAEGQESHGFPPGYYFLTYSLFMWPFAVMALEGGLKALNRFRSDPRLMFLLAWYIPTWLLFELVPTKLPHYVLPLYPALLLLMGWAITDSAALADPLRRWQVWLLRAARLGAVIVTLALAAIAAIASPYLAGSLSIIGIVAALALLVAGWFGIFKARRLDPVRSAAIVAGSGALGLSLVFANVLPALTPMWLSPQMATMFDNVRSCDDTVLASVGYHEPSLVFLTQTQTLLLGPAAGAEHLTREGACAIVAVSSDQLEAFLAALPNGMDDVTQVGRVEGINYSKGDPLTITFFTGAE